MRIENGKLDSVVNSGASGGVHSVNSDSRLSGSDADSPSDSVHLSGASSLIALARNLSAADRQSRVSTLTAQVQSGKYKIDAGQVSNAILESHA